MQFCGWRAVRATSPQHGHTQWMVRIISSLGLMLVLLRRGKRHRLSRLTPPDYARLNIGRKLIGPMDPIDLAYKWALTGAGNHGAIDCHNGEATTSSTGATCDSCTWRRMPCCVVSSPRQGTAA